MSDPARVVHWYAHPEAESMAGRLACGNLDRGLNTLTTDDPELVTCPDCRSHV